MLGVPSSKDFTLVGHFYFCRSSKMILHLQLRSLHTKKLFNLNVNFSNLTLLCLVYDEYLHLLSTILSVPFTKD